MIAIASAPDPEAAAARDRPSWGPFAGAGEAHSVMVDP